MPGCKSNTIYGIGVDIEDIKRFKGIINNKSFLEKVYTDKEVAYCKRFVSPESHLAVKFAAKEATLKAIGHYGNGIEFREMEILNKKNGEPFISIKRKRLKEKFSCFISLSHSDTSAVAFSVVTVNKRGR